MNHIKLTDIHVENRSHVVMDYSVSGDWEKCFSSQRSAFIDYDVDVSSVPAAVLAVPFICNIITAAWVCDAVVEAGSVDADFTGHLEEIKKGYTEMYPMIELRGELKAESQHVDTPSDGGCACFFSGGLDAHTTFYRHLDERPALISIWGSDIRLDDE